jgi:hypothetical protein
MSHRVRRYVLIASGLLVVVLAGTVVWFLVATKEPRAVTIDEARQRSSHATVSTAPAGQFGPPRAGVYVYRGTGTEKTSFPPLTERQGPTMPATVTAAGDGCWRFRIDLNTHHWQDWRFCADTSGVTSTGGRTFSRREYPGLNLDNVSTFTCEAGEVWLWAGMRPGSSVTNSSSGSGTAVGGTTTAFGRTTYLGDVEVHVGGRTVRARHLRYARTLRGAQVGTERADWWVDPWTMLPLRQEHHVDVRTKVGSLNIRYTESSRFELTAAEPT